MKQRERESVQEEQDVERVTVVRTMSATVKLAKMLDQVVQKVPRSVPWRPCSQPSRRRLATWTSPGPRRAEQKTPRSVSTAWCHGWRLPATNTTCCGEQSSLVLSRPTEGRFLGEVKALDSHEQLLVRLATESDCGGSHVKRVLTRRRKTL